MPAAIAPPRLREGDSVALIAPAGALAGPESLALAIERVEALGLRAKPGRHALDRHGYLAGTDEARTEDVNAALRDPDIRAIFALRGGYGTTRLLGAVDYDAFARDPKVALGYSDLTALLNALHARTGIVTYHGPVATAAAFGANAIDWLRRALFDETIGTLAARAAQTIRPGRAQGRLIGGNLSLIAALVGTPYAVDFGDAIAFFEDVDEAPYRIDRMLTQLRSSGSFRGVRGIVIGECRNCEAAPDTPFESSLAYVLGDRLSDLSVPTIVGTPIGHIDEQWTLPIGAHVELDADRKTLSF